MKNELFDFLDYREYLLEWIAAKPKRGRGMRVSLSDYLRCPLSHISQVLNGSSNLTFEQAEDLNDFLGHSESQAEYFLLIIQFARAGSERLKLRIKNQIQKIKAARFTLNKRLEVKASLSTEDQALFYSSWHFAAIHILLTINAFQTKDAVSKYLGLSMTKTTEALDTLLRLNLVTYKQGRYQVGTSRVHLGSDSPMISRHHINWRLQTIRALDNIDNKESLHYSSVVSIARADMLKIKSILIKSIESAKEVIRDSEEEELHSICMDFFKV